MFLNGLRLSKHDQYVEELCSLIKERYDSVSKHVSVKVKKRMLAEADVIENSAGFNTPHFSALFSIPNVRNA